MAVGKASRIDQGRKHVIKHFFESRNAVKRSRTYFLLSCPHQIPFAEQFQV